VLVCYWNRIKCWYVIGIGESVLTGVCDFLRRGLNLQCVVENEA